MTKIVASIFFSIFVGRPIFLCREQRFFNLLYLAEVQTPYGIMFFMEKNFEPLKSRLREINKRLDLDEQTYFGPLIESFSGNTSEFQRIMRDLGKFGSKIGTGSKFEVYREVQHLFHKALPKK